MISKMRLASFLAILSLSMLSASELHADVITSQVDPTNLNANGDATDDAEETIMDTFDPDGTQASNGMVGDVDVGSSDLELSVDHNFNGEQMVGMRFNDLAIPVGATINSAHIQFTVDDTDSSDPIKEGHHRALGDLTISGELSANALTFSETPFDITSRADTVASVVWSPADWGPQSNVGSAGPDQLTSDLSSILQEIVDQGGWASGNSAVFFLTGNGDMTREAESADGSSSGTLSPILTVDFVPEPATGLLILFAGLGMLLTRKRS
jgi:hypothetical protein